MAFRRVESQMVMAVQLALLCVARLSDACMTRMLAAGMPTTARVCTATQPMAFRRVHSALENNVDGKHMVRTQDALAVRGMHPAAIRGVRSRPPLCLAKPVKSSYYKRPAAALERGGGFYIPGLEGYRLRLLVGSVLSAALVANRITSPEPSVSQFVSEGLGGFSCLLLFIQVAADRAAEEDDRRELARAIATSRMEDRQQLAAQLDARVAEHAEWLARALLRLLPADVVMLLDGEALQTAGEHELPGVLLRFGRFEPTQQPAVLEILKAMNSNKEQDVQYLSEINSKRDTTLGLPSNTGSAVMVCCGGQKVLVICSQRSDAFTEKHLRYARSLARSMQLKFDQTSE
mmetsp:Transcript_19038/g.40327  ORF Transcript_19038/g.40327 Transcript_19038/m.40327 type:complete len:347 (-) Transcript_19038:747-1787(-)